MSYASDKLLKDTVAKVAELERDVAFLKAQLADNAALVSRVPAPHIEAFLAKRGPGRPRKDT